MKYSKVFGTFALAMLTMPAFALTGDLVINRVLINPQSSGDDGQGREGFEIKNVGSVAVNLGTLKVALVAIESESGQNGELDFWYELTGTLQPGDVMAIRDSTATTGSSSGTVGSMPTASLAGTYATTTPTITEFFDPGGPGGNRGVEMANSGCNYILVAGFDKTKIDPNTGLAYKFLAQLDDSGTALEFDFKASGTTNDDLWTEEYDLFAVREDTGGFVDYSTFLTLPHKVIPIAQTGSGGWTPDYAFRLFYDNGTPNDLTDDVYDKAFCADLNSNGTLSSSEHNTLDGSSWSWIGGTPTNMYSMYLKKGNWTDNASFGGLSIGGVTYQH